jgi:hypothetical protein
MCRNFFETTALHSPKCSMSTTVFLKDWSVLQPHKNKEISSTVRNWLLWTVIHVLSTNKITWTTHFYDFSYKGCSSSRRRCRQAMVASIHVRMVQVVLSERTPQRNEECDGHSWICAFLFVVGRWAAGGVEVYFLKAWCRENRHLLQILLIYVTIKRTLSWTLSLMNWSLRNSSGLLICTCARLNRTTGPLSPHRFEACAHHQTGSCTLKVKRRDQFSFKSIG